MRGNSITNYAKEGTVPDHLAIIAIMMVRLEELRIDTKALLRELNLAPKSPRGAGLGKFGGNPQLILFKKQPDFSEDSIGGKNPERDEGASSQKEGI